MTTGQPTSEQQQRRRQADVDYQAALERSPLNRRRWPAEVLAEVATAEARMAAAVAERRRHDLEEGH